MIWKTLGGRCIYQIDGIRVRQNLFYRWLTFDDGALQTVMNRYHPERSVLQYIKPLTLCARVDPGQSCLLGLGGASAAHTLAPYMNQFNLDAVENNIAVIDIADRYFMTKTIENMHIIHQDAITFVQQSSSCSYKHIMIDLFNAQTFPEQCNHSDFFKHCHRLLLHGGILALNLANLHDQWPVLNHVREHFPHCTVSIPVKHCANLVLLAIKSKSVDSLLNVLKSNGNLKQLTWDAKWGYVAR